MVFVNVYQLKIVKYIFVVKDEVRFVEFVVVKEDIFRGSKGFFGGGFGWSFLKYLGLCWEFIGSV